MFQCPRGLELLRMISTLRSGVWRFNALTGLSCYLIIMTKFLRSICFNALTGLSCYGWGIKSSRSGCRNCFNALTGLSCYGPSIALLPSFTLFQCPHGLELLPITRLISSRQIMFQCPLGLELLHHVSFVLRHDTCFNALSGLSCYGTVPEALLLSCVSMPSRAWVVTARMSNILNFLWYFLCIPAIYKCILAYLSIFFNQLSEFLRCESPSTFLGTCLSHHSFIWW